MWWCFTWSRYGLINLELSRWRVYLIPRSIGRQHLGALFNIVAYYVLALPIGISLAFHPHFELGLQGLWIGLPLFLLPPTFLLKPHCPLGQVLALFIVGIGEYCVVWLGTDWDLEVQRGQERNREEAKQHGDRSDEALESV